MLKHWRKLLVNSLGLGLLLLSIAPGAQVTAASGINQEINFQGRLLNAQGAVVPDGYYNMEFKIYQDGDGQSVGDTTGSPAGALKWTEDWLNTSGGSKGVEVKNGYLSVQLGSRTAFGANVNWDADTLWLSMQVGNTNACTIVTNFQTDCGGDGEMTPMKRLSSTPYALNSGLLQGLTSAQFIQLAQGVQTDNSTTSSIFINKTAASGNIAELQSNAVDVFKVANTGATTIAAVSPASGNAADVLTVTGGNGAATASAGNGSNIILTAGNGGNGTTTNGNGGSITLSAGAAGGGIGSAGTAGSIIIKNASNSADAFQIQNSTNSQPVLAVDTNNNQLVLGSPGASGLTGGIKLFYKGSSGSITLVMSDPGSNNYNLTIPSGGGTICTTANGLCSGGGTGSGGLAKNAPDTSSADAVTGYLYAFTNTGNAETGGVLSLDNGNNTGSALFLKDTSTKAFQVQNSSGYDALVLDTSGNPAHLKIYDGTATAAYADISYNDSTSSAIYTASTGTAQFGGGSVPTLLTAGSGQAVNITGHTDSSWTLDGGNLTIDVTGTTPTMNIGTGAAAKTLNIGNQSGATAVNIKAGSGNINFIPVGTGSTGVVVKAQNASTKAFQVQNSSTSKLVMSVDTSGNQVVIGDGSSSGITGQLAFKYTGASGEILLKPSASPGSSTFTLQLPTENGTICTTAASAACVSAYGGGTSGSNFLAKNSVDTSSAAAASYLYEFTNSTSGGSGGVLSLDNGNNTGSTLSATTSGNPGTGKAVIYAQNTNASPSGNLLDLEAGATPASVFSVDASGKLTAAGTSINGSALTFGGASSALVQPAASQALNITGHADSTWSLDAGNLTIQTSAASSNLTLDSGAVGTIAIGGTDAGTINIGNLALASGTQDINIGTNNTSGGTTNVTIGSGSSATGGTTTVQSKDNAVIATNGVARATFDTSGKLYLGNGVASASPANFTISGTDSSADGAAGSTLTIQGGNATVGNANGGNISISGGGGAGTGVSGLVLLATPTFSTITADPNCYTSGAPVTNSCTIAQTSVDDSSSVIVGFSTEGNIATLPSPTISTPGRIIYVTAAAASKDFTLEVNGGGTGNDIAMRQNTSATMIWNGTGWTAAGASSSTTLQAAYDNTLQSAGGAELVVSHTSATNGLTIRDSLTNPVNGTLLSVQTNSAASIISINGNVTEYASDAGAETAGNTADTFPADSWAAIGGASVSRYTTYGSYVDTGEGSVSVGTTTASNDGVSNTLSAALTANMHYNVSFAARLSSGIFTDMNVYYSVDGTTASVACTADAAITISVWTKVNCAFAAPSSGITAGNAILIRQTGGGTARNFFIDNLSVTIAADYNYATDGGVDDSANFSTNWTSVNGATVSRSTTVGYDASDSAEADTTGAGQGVRNQLAINPLASTLYRITVYASSTAAGFDSFTVQYSPNGGGSFVDCADYNTQSISSSTTNFTEVTCYINTTSTTVTSPYVYFTQSNSDATARTFYVDTFSMTLSGDTTPNVQIGAGVNGGPVTLLTLDRAASAPIASNNDAFLGSMYYDTTLGELQCYQADGWGSCGSSPNTVVTISPEFTNAVMHGTGIGTMNSDICSGTLHINDGTSGQASVCSSSETYNFYKWTSPQASTQTYSIYVTYELPSTFKTFASGKTSIMGRTDSNNATVQYSVYRENSTTGLTQCGPVVPVSTGSVSSWQTGIASGAADPSTCGFSANDSILFKIDVIASQDADAYVGNLNFIFSHK